MSRTTVPLVISITLAFGMLAFSGVAVADDVDSELRVKVMQGKSERIGGDWIAIRVGDILFGVVYGNELNPQHITMFGEYDRYIGGADIYDERGNYLRTRSIPVSSVYTQSLFDIVEFLDADGDGMFDLRKTEDIPLGGDVPLKRLDLKQAWTLSDYDFDEGTDSATLDFTLSVENAPYAWLWDRQNGTRIPGKDVRDRLEEVAISFHINVSLMDANVEDIPWYKVTIGGFPDWRVLKSEFVGYRIFQGKSVNMSFKYDHLINGWDFANSSSKLAMDTRLVVGNRITSRVAEFVREQSRLKVAEENGDYNITEKDEAPTRPQLIEKNRIQFYDDWYRLGRLTWASDVEVDGQQQRMLFEIYGAGPAGWQKDSIIFRGFTVMGAFVYPQGQTIFHDPEFADTVYLFSVPFLTNMLPPGVMLVQLVLGSLGVVIAFIVSTRRWRGKGGD